MTEIQELQLNMLIKLDEVCHRHHLRYYLAFGTCIGAVRHKGFIPWDHDVDVLMPADDAYKLIDYQSEFGDRYFVSSYRTDRENHPYTSMLLVDQENKCKYIQNNKVIKETHVAMDIYLFYPCPKSRVAMTWQVWRSHLHKILVGGMPKNHGRLAKLIGKLFLLFYPEEKREESITHIERKLHYTGPSDTICDFFGQDVSLFSGIQYRKEWFGEPSRLMFEGHEFDGPTDPHQYLTKRYGDYMTPPDQRIVEQEVRCELVKG